MLRRFAATVTLIVMAGLAIPGAASAHVLKIDGSIGGVLHINPDDNPTTGNATDYILSFDDDSGKFSLAKCDCSVSIVENGKTIATKPLAVSSSEVSENHYTFTKPDVYTMRFTGKPKQAGAFQPFTLTYPVRVTNGQTSAQSMPAALWVGMSMGIGLILLAAYAMDYDDSRKNKRRRT